MTAYFDAAHERLRALEPSLLAERAPLSAHDAVEAFEHEIVNDCSVAAGFPGFPADLRDAIDAVVLKHGIATQPLNAPSSATEDVETMSDHVRRLHSLIWDLHSVFHDVARLELDGFNDSPLTPVRRLAGEAAARREDIVAARPGARSMTELFGSDEATP